MEAADEADVSKSKDNDNGDTMPIKQKSSPFRRKLLSNQQSPKKSPA